EDGIRNFHVTGVQTCALPIYHLQSGADAMTNMIAAIGPSRQFVGPPVAEVLCARLANFRVDVARLREHFERKVKAVEPTPYRDSAEERRGGEERRGVRWEEAA